MRTVVTGAAGFIGSFVAKRLLERGDAVLGIDNLSDYYDPQLKRARLERLTPHQGFAFAQIDVADQGAVDDALRDHRPQHIVHLAAQAGVRHSIANPRAYVDANVAGFLSILEAARAWRVEHLVYASSSAVYGGNETLPFAVSDNVDRPLSMYAATKKCNELMAHAYSHLHGLPTTGLRFFTVYGPWGRPDMALFVFARKILADEPIDLFNHGRHRRDFTYIDDIVEGILRVLARPPGPSTGGDTSAPYRIYNIGRGEPVELLRFVELIEKNLGRRARRNPLPLQPGDVPDSHADVAPLAADFDFRPQTPVAVGVARFVAWYRDYYAAGKQAGSPA